MSIRVKRLAIIGTALASLAPLMGCEGEDASMANGTVEETPQALQNGTVVSYPIGGSDSIARAVVAVGDQQPAGHGFLGGCTATLLSTTWVITARHCVADATGAIPNIKRVHHFPSGSEVDVPIANIYVHPDPNIDVALLHLPTAISTGQGAISLFTGEDADVVNKSVTTYGFGEIDHISQGCANGKTCAANYFCSGTDCILGGGLVNVVCTTNANCPSSYPVCDMANNTWGHCYTGPSGNTFGLRKAIFTVSEVVRGDMQGGAPVYNGKYLTLPPNSSGQFIRSGDSGGPTFINGQLVGVTGGGYQVAYAKVFRKWANGIMSPPKNYSISSSRTTITNNFAPTGSQVRTGDVNGDGYVDLVQFNQALGPQGSVYVIPGSASGFGAETRLNTNFSTGTQVPAVGDMDGDGKADAITFDLSNGDVWVALSDGTQFGTGIKWRTQFCYTGQIPRVGDVNGDGRADILCFVSQYGGVYAGLSCGNDANNYPAGCNGTSKIGAIWQWASSFVAVNDVPWVGDVNGDGMADLVDFSTDGNVYVALTSRQTCTANSQCPGNVCWTAQGICPGTLGNQAAARTKWGSGFPQAAGETPMLADMNGDGYVDAVNFEAVSGSHNGYVGVALSNSGKSFGTYTVKATGFCHQNDVCVVGDITHDGMADVFDFIPGGADSYSLSTR